MLNVFGDKELKSMGYTMFTVNPLTSMAPLEIYIVDKGRVLKCRLCFHSKSEGGTGTAQSIF